jgi:hypothetical protein
MSSGRQAGAYPSLIPGNQEGARDANKPWDVVILEGDFATKAGAEGPSTSKAARIIKLPDPKLQHDWQIRYHELCHVERPTWEQSKNGLRNAVRQMLEEVALDGMAVLRDGIDLRSARDHFDWDKFGRPTDFYKAALMIFQVFTSAEVTQSQSLERFHKDGWTVGERRGGRGAQAGRAGRHAGRGRSSGLQRLFCRELRGLE